METIEQEVRPPRGIIIGAGVSGIVAAVALARAGITDYTIYEKADRVGGTWRDNTYPGVACDVPSHLYSFSFAPNPDWSRQFAAGTEIQAYVEDVAHRYGVVQRMRFGEEVVRCEFANGRWHVETASGRRDSADFVISATGITHHPNTPDIPGLDTFAGAAFHSARWNHDVPLEGRRVGVIGTGSSAVQIVSALVERVGRLTLFQRTPQWVMPQENRPFSAADREALRRDPDSMQALRASLERRFVQNFSDAVVDADSPRLQAIEALCREHLETTVVDPELRARLRPDYQVACKRLIISSDFYRAIQHPNAELVTERIARIEPEGVRTHDQRLHALDVLVLATGFRTDRFIRPVEVIGAGGRRLDVVWNKRPTAYMCVAVPEFPNFFMLNGPNGPVGNYPLIEVAELQMGYVLQLIELLRTGRCRTVAPRADSTAAFEQARIEAAKRTVWTTGCRSWYLDDEGVPAAWPWTIRAFRDAMAAPQLDHYELTAAERS